MSTPQRIGVLGGTFDPIHLGHTALAEAARACGGLDRVLVVPAGVPPHRQAPSASDEDRLAMCRLAVAGHPGLEVSDVELCRGGPSFTSTTLEEIGGANPGAEVYLILGWDAARLLRTWHEPDRVLALARVLVVPRPGLPDPTPDDLAAAGLPEDRVRICRGRTPEVGATELRRHLRDRDLPPGELDPAVAAYVASRGLYRG